MVQNKFLKVLTRLLELQKKNNALLQPICSLKEIVRLEVCRVFAVGVEFVVCGGVEVPDRGVVHNIQSVRSEYRKVDSSVGLLHETSNLGLLGDVVVKGDRAEEL